MQIQMTARHTQITPDVRELVERKVSKLERFVHKPAEVHLVLSLEKHRRNALFVVLNFWLKRLPSKKEPFVPAITKNVISKKLFNPILNESKQIRQNQFLWVIFICHRVGDPQKTISCIKKA